MAFYRDKWFWFVLLSTAIIKLLAGLYLYFLNPLGEQAFIFPDSITYVYPAQTWLTYGQFWEAVSAAPMLLRTPGYPLFLALVQIFSNASTWAVVAAQNILSLALLIPVYLSARRLAGLIAARVAALCCAISVVYFSFSFAILSELLCTFLLAWFVYFLLRFLEQPRRSFLAAGAVFLAAAIYVRPAAYYLPFWLVPLLFFLKPAEYKKTIVAFILPLLVMLGAWHMRNVLVSGYSGFTTVNAYNLYFWNEDFVAKQQNMTIPQAHIWLGENLPADFASRSAAQQVHIYRRLAQPWLKSGWKHKLLHAPKWAAKTLLGTNFVHTSRLLLGAPADDQELNRRALDQTRLLHAVYLKTFASKALLGLSLLQIGLLLLGAAAGLYQLVKKHTPQAWFLGIYCLYFWAVGSVFFGAYARFRAPFEFVLCILAGIAAAARLQTQTERID